MKKLFVIALLLIHLTGLGQEMSQTERSSTIFKISEMLSKHYVLIDTSKLMIERINSNLKNGHYDSIASHEAFANKLTSDLRLVYPDQHMGIYYKRAIRPKKREFLNQIKNSKQCEWKVLEGNIGYVDLNTFMFHDPKGKRLVNSAMNDLKNVDAVIIDVRDNFGGNGNIANYLASQFLPPKKLISTAYKRKGDELKPIKKNFSKGKIHRFQKNNIPVCVLINEKTASAGESIAYSLQAFDRATIIGEKSAGAAHANIDKSINKSFSMFMPHEKVINSITSSDYEFTGVIPDVPVSSDMALESALNMIGQNSP